MSAPRKLSAHLQARIVTLVRAGTPPEVAARSCGIPVTIWMDWMGRKSRTYRDLQLAVDQAEAEIGRASCRERV